MFLGCLGAVCWEAELAQGARPSQPGHVHKPPPKSTREETLLNWCTVPELDPDGRALPFWSIWLRLGLPVLLTLYSLPPSGASGRPQPLINIGKRMENQEFGGLSNMTEVVCFNWGKDGHWVLRGGGVRGLERRWMAVEEDLLSLWVGGGVLAILGARLGLQILVILGLDVLVLVRGDGALQIGPVGCQNHQVVDLKRNNMCSSCSRIE